jgi:hypothetical protein
MATKRNDRGRFAASQAFSRSSRSLSSRDVSFLPGAEMATGDAGVAFAAEK